MKKTMKKEAKTVREMLLANCKCGAYHVYNCTCNDPHIMTNREYNELIERIEKLEEGK